MQLEHCYEANVLWYTKVTKHGGTSIRKCYGTNDTSASGLLALTPSLIHSLKRTPVTLDPRQFSTDSLEFKLGFLRKKKLFRLMSLFSLVPGSHC